MTEMMSSGVELMLAGMSIVFLFLTMLVIAINLMSSLVQRFFRMPPFWWQSLRFPAVLIKASLPQLLQRCISIEANIKKIKYFWVDVCSV